jgi:hypothetical protein
MTAHIAAYIRPYKAADFYQWTQIGQRFKVKSRGEAIAKARRDGYTLIELRHGPPRRRCRVGRARIEQVERQRPRYTAGASPLHLRSKETTYAMENAIRD